MGFTDKVKKAWDTAAGNNRRRKRGLDAEFSLKSALIINGGTSIVGSAGVTVLALTGAGGGLAVTLPVALAITVVAMPLVGIAGFAALGQVFSLSDPHQDNEKSGKPDDQNKPYAPPPPAP